MRETYFISYRKESQQDDHLATPMSVEVSTPMSVDKTALDDEQVQKAIAIKNDRDRFFEVAEYQKDILKYLKVVEVKVLFT